jgi:hypothetical protein
MRRTPVEMYLSRNKINADYTIQDVTQPISTNAFMIYVPTAQIDLAIIYLTRFSTLSAPTCLADPMFIPLTAKYHSPGKFGQYVARHNSYLHAHRHIAMIVGVVPEAMDTVASEGDTLWGLISSLPGVHRCDPCRRTPDLGKWNISCEQVFHTSIATWIDTNLAKLWSDLPVNLPFPVISTFPIPERLSKGRSISAGSSVASGLTNASHVEDYFRKLERSLPPQALPSHPTRNAWKNHLPIGDISYSFNTEEFPKLVDEAAKPNGNAPTIATATATGSIIGNTAVSAITESMVSHTVKSGITAFELKRKLAHYAFDARMATLEKQVNVISSQVTQMATQITQAVIATLTADDGIIKRQEDKMDKMEKIILKMATSVSTLIEQGNARENAMVIHSPPRSPRDRELVTDNDTSDDCNSPDRQRQKLNQGVPTESGTGTCTA